MKKFIAGKIKKSRTIVFHPIHGHVDVVDTKPDQVKIRYRKNGDRVEEWIRSKELWR